MLVNCLTTETGNQILLLDQVFGPERLNQLHAMCNQFEPGCKNWPQPDWCVECDLPRYMFDNQGHEWEELKEFFNSAEFKHPIEQYLGVKLQRSVASFWADLTGFGTLGPHKEAGGSYMMQVYLTNTSHDYSGTTIYNESKQILVQLPYRDNFAWLFHGMKVMHGRHHDVPEGLTRFTLQVWFYEEI